MKIHTINIFFSLLTIFIVSCNNENNIKIVKPITNIKRIDTIHIPKTLEDIAFNPNHDIKDVHYVKLETTLESSFGAIDKIFVTKDRIIIKDGFVSASIFFFDRQGKFLAKSTAGKGTSNHFASLRDATFDYDNNVLSVFDDKKKSIVNFDQNGNFLGKVPIYYFFLRFAYIGNSYFALQSPSENRGVSGILNDYDLAIANKEGKMEYASWDNAVDKKILPDFDYNIKVPSSGSGKFNYYCPKFSSTIFRLETSPLTIYPRFYLKYLGKNNIVPNESMTYSQYKNIKKNSFDFDGDIVSSGDVHFFKLWEKNIPTGVFYSSKSKKIIGGEILLMVKINEVSKVAYYSYPISSTNGEFISVMDIPTVVENEITSLDQQKKYGIKLPMREKQLDLLIKKVKKSDNPILLFYKVNI